MGVSREIICKMPYQYYDKDVMEGYYYINEYENLYIHIGVIHRVYLTDLYFIYICENTIDPSLKGDDIGNAIFEEYIYKKYISLGSNVGFRYGQAYRIYKTVENKYKKG